MAVKHFLRFISSPFASARFLTLTFVMSVCFSVLPAHLDAQDDTIIFTQLSIEEGLSQSIVECITQDNRGFMWFGTEDGLNRFDGYNITVLRHNSKDPNSLSYNEIRSLLADRSGILWIGTFHGGLDSYDPISRQFTHYRHDPNDSTSLSHNIVHTIYEDRSGVLWAGTSGGLNRFDAQSGSFVRYQHDPGDPNSLGDGAIHAICEDQSGALWVGTDGGGLNKFDAPNNRFIRYTVDPNDSNTLSHNSVRSLHADQSGILWVGTNGGGLDKLDIAGERFTHYHHDPGDRHSLSHDQVYSIYEDQSGILWIGTNGGGLNKFYKETGKFIRYMNDPNDLNSIGYNEIRVIYEDRSGVIWIGTYGGGVNKFDRKRKRFNLYRPDLGNPNSLSQDIVWTIYEDAKGLLWIGTHGGGLDRFDRSNGRFTHYFHDPADPSSISGNIVRVVYEDRSGTLWVGTHGGGICSFDRRTERFTAYHHVPGDPGSLSHDEIRSMYEDRRGMLWIGTNGGGLNKFDRTAGRFTTYRNDPADSNSLSNDFVRVIHEDARGNFWIGTQGGGLNKFDRERETFTHYRADIEDSTALNNDFIFSIHEDNSGILWMGTWGGGLNKFDPARGIFKSYTTADGFESDAIYGALEDDQGNLWISSNNGLSRFDPRTEAIKNYSVEDGLQSNEFNGGSFFKSKSGEMFFGGIYGFNSFYPQEITDNPYPPQIVITSFLKMNKEADLPAPISELEELTLSYQDYIFAFEFAALDYAAPRKNLYAYKMEGLHGDWIYTDSSKRFATFTTLSPGRYTFRVKGSNNDGVWNAEGTSIRVIITPPFWSTWWFRGMLVLSVLSIAYALYRWRLGSVRMATELKTAHAAQMSIMPQSDPEVDGFDISGACIPANDVGGDFYDLFWHDDDRTRLCITIGDVSGKAMEAAMIAVMSNGMVYSRADETSLPGEVLTHLNRPICMKTGDTMFTALFLASLDVSSKTLTYSLAGMNVPVLKSGASTGSISSKKAGPPLGAFCESGYADETMQFKTGDVLILFTDGIIESQNSSGDFYDDERLLALIRRLPTDSLSARQIKDAIIKDVNAFVGNAVQQDDMTIVVVKCI